MLHTEQLSQTSTTGEEEASRRVEIRTELGEGSDFTVLCKVQLERTGELLHDLAVKVAKGERGPSNLA